MPLDGAGTYAAPAPANPAIPNTTIASADYNTTIQDLVTALSTALYRDGQAPMTGDLNFANHALNNLLTLVGSAAGLGVSNILTLTALAAGGTLAGNWNASGTVTATTQTPADASTKLGTTAYVDAAVLVEKTGALAAELLLAPLASPALTGVPTAPTAAVGTNTTQIATMAALLAQSFLTALPAQAGNASKFVTTDGVNASWVALPPPVGSTLYLATNFGAL